MPDQGKKKHNISEMMEHVGEAVRPFPKAALFDFAEVCTGALPGCSICPVLIFYQQVGIAAHR
jgi:hypothetical protein